MFRSFAASSLPAKPWHLMLWAIVKASIWAILGTLWLVSGQVPWKAALIGEIIAYGPIPIYLAWVAFKLYRSRRSDARDAAAAATS